MMKFRDEKDSEKDEEFIEEKISDDESFEEIDETEGDMRLRIQELKEKLKVAERERKEYLDGWQRAKADYLNSSKRFAEERSELITRSASRLIESFLPLCDSFDMALASNGNGDSGEGLKRINAQLRSILKEAGVTEVSDVGVPFSPHLHEALKSEAVTDKDQHDTVVAILQKGYKRGEFLLRPAKVVVGVFEE